MMHDGGFSATATVAFYDKIVQLWKEFGKISISHYNRSCNSVAYELAKQTLVEKSSQVYATFACKRCSHLYEFNKVGVKLKKNMERGNRG